MSRVKTEHIDHAVKQASSISLEDREAVIDIIHTEQPNLLASIIVQQQMGNTLEQIEVLLELLLVIHLALKDAGITLAIITEGEQENHSGVLLVISTLPMTWKTTHSRRHLVSLLDIITRNGCFYTPLKRRWMRVSPN